MWRLLPARCSPPYATTFCKTLREDSHPAPSIPTHIQAMSEKKRKRESEKGDRPAKKVAFQAPEKVKVQLLADDAVLGPVIGMFFFERDGTGV